MKDVSKVPINTDFADYDVTLTTKQLKHGPSPKIWRQAQEEQLDLYTLQH